MDDYLDPATGLRYTSPTQPVNIGQAGDYTTDLWMLSTPSATSWARTQYGCPAMAGMMLENELQNSPPSHLEQRIAFNDVMSPQRCALIERKLLATFFVVFVLFCFPLLFLTFLLFLSFCFSLFLLLAP